ncbi:hypothetical protein ALC53_10688 [Atta colombica]|uniref:Uncharacterized protein n=1 Tax=Atta colombica TaxID=520822 RepID=A0A151HZZ8_9HYME|nr:hypothetical protein ALC53_10688 [Atta colombica]
MNTFVPSSEHRISHFYRESIWEMSPSNFRERGLNTGNLKADALRDEADNVRREQTRLEISYATVDEKNQLLITNLWLKLVSLRRFSEVYERNKISRDVFSIDSCHLHEQHEIRGRCFIFNYIRYLYGNDISKQLLYVIVAATGYYQSTGSEGASLLGLRQCFLERERSASDPFASDARKRSLLFIFYGL